MLPTVTLLGALGLALIHLFARRLRWLSSLPRSVWLSFAGGVSVAYVFVHLLPDLGEYQEAVAETGVLAFLEHHVYLVALLGLAVFYGLERTALRSRRARKDAEGEDSTSAEVFWLHIASFAAYNALIGYLLVHREETEWLGLALFVIALGFHFVVNDVGLREHHKESYDRAGRWLLAAAVLVGWAVAQVVAFSPATVALLFAFLAGGVLLNVLKEELPEERASQFWPFAAGAAGYAAKLLLLGDR
ncbi:MAG: hypothetical protein RLZZ387_3933 [Chloroflexota bacterium]|jgi:zinc transporter ZupT